MEDEPRELSYRVRYHLIRTCACVCVRCHGEYMDEHTIYYSHVIGLKRL